MATLEAINYNLTDLQSLSPSSRAVLNLLLDSGPMTPTKIVESVGFASRTVRYALKDLLARELVDKKPYLPDMRRTLYQIKHTEMQELEKLKAFVVSQQQR